MESGQSLSIWISDSLGAKHLGQEEDPLHLARKSECSQVSSDCEMCVPIQSLDPLLRVEGEGVPRVPVYLDSDSEQHMGDVAREGMELAGSGWNAVSSQ
jgi:hypothetical protein